MRRLSVTLFLTWMILYASAQCPDGVNITHNSFCLFLSWVSPPSPLPDMIGTDGESYSLISGPGTEADPAIYKNGGGGGSCSSAQYPYQGTLEVNGSSCTYSEGALPVTLLEFTVRKAENNKVLLSWSLTGAGNTETIEVKKVPTEFPGTG